LNPFTACKNALILIFTKQRWKNIINVTYRMASFEFPPLAPSVTKETHELIVTRVKNFLETRYLWNAFSVYVSRKFISERKYTRWTKCEIKSLQLSSRYRISNNQLQVYRDHFVLAVGFAGDRNAYVEVLPSIYERISQHDLRKMKKKIVSEYSQS